MTTTRGRHSRAPARPDRETELRRDEIVSDLGEMDDARRDLVMPVATEVAWLERRLSATRLDLAGQGVTVAYDNGGGQSGIRRNPAFEGYHALLKSYVLALRALRDLAAGEAGGSEGEVGSLADMRRGSPLFKVV